MSTRASATPTPLSLESTVKVLVPHTRSHLSIASDLPLQPSQRRHFLRVRHLVSLIARCLSFTGRLNALASDGGTPGDARSFADGSQIGQTLALFSIDSCSSHSALLRSAAVNPLRYSNPCAVTCLRPRPGNGVRLPGWGAGALHLLGNSRRTWPRLEPSHHRPHSLQS